MKTSLKVIIGFPIQIIIGEKKIVNGEVELKVRKTKEAKIVKIEETVQIVKELLSSHGA